MTRKIWMLGLVAAISSAGVVRAGRVALVEKGRAKCVWFAGAKWKTGDGALVGVDAPRLTVHHQRHRRSGDAVGKGQRGGGQQQRQESGQIMRPARRSGRGR